VEASFADVAADMAAGKSRAVVAVEEREDDNDEAKRSSLRANRWFGQDIFSGLAHVNNSQAVLARMEGNDGSDSDPEINEIDDKKIALPLTDKQKRKAERKKKEDRLVRMGIKRGAEPEEDNGPMEIAPLEAPKPLVPVGPQKPDDPMELAQTLAMGSVLVDSKKARMDIIDAGYNRWTFDDDIEALPEWFMEEEQKFNKPELPISKELFQQYMDKMREINARPIRKVAEAKARKGKRLKKRLDKLRKNAMDLSENTELSARAKAKDMRKQVKNALKGEKRAVTKVAISAGGGGKKQDKGKTPQGAKTKVVDRRLKSDARAERRAAKKKGKKGQVKKNQKMAKKKNKGKGGGQTLKKGSGGKR